MGELLKFPRGDSAGPYSIEEVCLRIAARMDASAKPSAASVRAAAKRVQAIHDKWWGLEYSGSYAMPPGAGAFEDELRAIVHKQVKAAGAALMVRVLYERFMLELGLPLPLDQPTVPF